MIVKLEEAQQKLTEELSKIRDEKDQEMIAKVEEAKKKFGEEMSTKLKQTKENFTEEIEKLKEENNQLLRKRNVRETEKDEMKSNKKRRESQDEPKAVGSEEDISVIFKQIKRKKRVGVFTHIF